MKKSVAIYGITFGLLSLWGLTACSVYQSEGRKFLDNPAVVSGQFRNATITPPSSRLHSCSQFHHKPESLEIGENWAFTDYDPERGYSIYTSEDPDNYAIIIYVSDELSHKHYLCTFEYSTASEMLYSQDADVDLALQSLNEIRASE